MTRIKHIVWSNMIKISKHWMGLCLWTVIRKSFALKVRLECMRIWEWKDGREIQQALMDCLYSRYFLTPRERWLNIGFWRRGERLLTGNIPGKANVQTSLMLVNGRSDGKGETPSCRVRSLLAVRPPLNLHMDFKQPPWHHFQPQ